jgi:hypothetical protein
MPTYSAECGLAPTVDEQFVRLIFSDEELSQAEFEAIIAGEWPPPVSPPIHEQAGAPTSDASHGTDAWVAGRVTRPHHPGIGGWARQRSPPPGQLRNPRPERPGDRHR